MLYVDADPVITSAGTAAGIDACLQQRVLLAQRLLEATDETVDTIAWRTGFGTAAALRHQFVRSLGTTPQAYRRTFRDPQAA